MTSALEEKGKRRLQLEDMWNMEFLTSPTVSPDGQWVVFVKAAAERSTGNFISQLGAVSAGGGELRDLPMAGSPQQTCPAFSPDGRQLAFLCNQSGENQIWLIDDWDAPAPRQLTTLRHGVTSFVWSPDGGRLAFTAPLFPNEPSQQAQSEMTAAERRDFEWQQENMPVVVEELMYKFDETFGVADGSFRQVGVIPVGGGPATMLTQDLMHHEALAWPPDGKWLAFYGYPYGHRKATKKECFLIAAEGGPARQLTENSVYWGDNPVIVTPDGQSLLYTRLMTGEEDGFFLKLYRHALQDGAVTCLFPDTEVCHGVDPLALGKSMYGKTNPAFQLSECGQYVYFVSGWKGYTHIYRLNLEGAPAIEQITHGAISVRTFCRPVQNKLVYTRSTVNSLDDVFCLDLATGQERRLTASNAWLDEINQPEPVEMWVASRDGTCQIHGYVLPPAVAGEGTSCPAVLDIHGGPEVYYTAGFWFEFQMLSAAGLAVIYCDPRGSTGYGREFAKEEFSWGEQSYDDLMAFVDAALKKFPAIDPQRLGVTGGSYGGHMTNRIIGKTDRFRAAVAQRTFANRATSYGTGDMGFISDITDKPPSFSDYMYNRVRRSPVTRIDAMQTPLLLLHGERDYRCTMEQSEQMFIPLKDRHPEVPVRMVIFPGENHNITRTGKMHFQIGHLREMIDWFTQYLGEEAQEKHD
jgi:dipeptidyl aminopeptidase/acylaminoacyl peptidase